MKITRGLAVSICIWTVLIAFNVYTHLMYDSNGYPEFDQEKCEGDTLELSEPIEPYLNLFIEDCKRAGVRYDHIYCLEGIYIMKPSDDQGITMFKEKIIAINQDLMKDSIGMQLVLYHEIGHWMGLPHGTGIMTPTYNTERDAEYSQRYWNELKDHFFAQLERKLNN